MLPFVVRMYSPTTNGRPRCHASYCGCSRNPDRPFSDRLRRRSIEQSTRTTRKFSEGELHRFTRVRFLSLRNLPCRSGEASASLLRQHQTKLTAFASSLPLFRKRSQLVVANARERYRCVKLRATRSRIRKNSGHLMRSSTRNSRRWMFLQEMPKRSDNSCQVSSAISSETAAVSVSSSIGLDTPTRVEAISGWRMQSCRFSARKLSRRD